MALRRQSSLPTLAFAMAIAALAPALAPASARAQATTTTTPTDAQRQRARELYAEGQRHFAANRFAEAQAAFEAAYAQVPNPVVLLGVASAQEHLGHPAEAAATLRRYLRERPDAPDRADVEQRIAQMEGPSAAPATIRIACTPEGAAIAIDGADTGQRAPADVQVPPGEHDVTLTMEGFQPITQHVTVVAGGSSELTLTLAAEGEPLTTGEDVLGAEGEGASTEITEETTTETAPVDPGPSVGVWVTTAVAGVALVTGTVFGFLALSAQSDFDANPTTDTADRGETFALVADLSFGVAIAAGVTAIVLYATERPSAPAEVTVEETETETETDSEETTGGEATPPPATTSRRDSGPRLTVAPWAAPTGGGAAMQVTF